MTEKKTYAQLIVRVDAKLKKAIEKYAADERRSQNMQTVIMLENELQKAGYLKKN